MTLTEEQRGALARAIDYINETDLPVGELDGFDREVLRAMIDSSDPITDVTELVELLAAGEHDQWAAWAQAILDSEPGLSDGRKAAWPGLIATPYENLSEELKDKDRREVHLRSSVALDIVQQQAARIKELESSLDEAEALTKKNAELMNAYLARIAELEDQIHKIARQYVCNSDYWQDRAKKAESKIRPDADHVVGPYQMVPNGKVWQITKEKKRALSIILEYISYDADDDIEICSHAAVLRAMLREAE